MPHDDAPVSDSSQIVQTACHKHCGTALSKLCIAMPPLQADAVGQTTNHLRGPHLACHLSLPPLLKQCKPCLTLQAAPTNCTHPLTLKEATPT